MTGPPPQAAAPSAPTLPAHEIVPEENPKSTAAPPPSATVEDQVSESHSLGM